jgi:hypothetical protein
MVEPTSSTQRHTQICCLHTKEKPCQVDIKELDFSLNLRAGSIVTQILRSLFGGWT